MIRRAQALFLRGVFLASLVLTAMSAFLPTGTSAVAIRMGVMGDSISAGSGVTGGSPNWVAQLASLRFRPPSRSRTTRSAVRRPVPLSIRKFPALGNVTQLASIDTLAAAGSIDDSVTDHRRQ